MLRASHAIRLGLRAATRNPELSFGKALLDQAGTAIAILPPVLAGIALVAMLGSGDPAVGLGAIFRAAMAVRWPLAGASIAALLLAWVLGVAFWAGALPVLAADARSGARPTPGAFFALLSRGFARVLGSAALAGALLLLSLACCVAAAAVAAPAFLARPSIAVVAGLALVVTAALIAGVLVELLARLALVRSAALGDSPVAALFHAASLLGGRFGTLLLVTLLFVVLELAVSGAATALTGVVSGAGLFDPRAQIAGIAPRIAVGLAFAAILAWLEVGRHGAFAAIAADVEGLLPPEPAPTPEPAEPVIEAIPAEPIIEALPAEPVVDALPIDEPKE